MKRGYVLIITIVLLFSSCGEYQKLLKSTDPEEKYNRAVEYYVAKRYDRAITLFSDISSYYRNTDRAELIINYLAKSHIEKKDYFSAAEYYTTYATAYPRGSYIQEAKFMLAFCHFKESPDVRLDQSATYKAVNAFQEFVDLYPGSERVVEANDYLRQLNDKLAEKELLSAKLYYDLGIYLGNNYLSSVITAENALKKYPSNKFREDLMFVILKSKYQQALYSDQSTLADRYQTTIDEAYTYMNEFPEGKFLSQAKDILRKSEKNMPEVDL